MPNNRIENLNFLNGGGDTGKLIRSIDWRRNPLGEPENWPTTLKNAVSIMFSTTFRMLILWGKNHIQLYNDAYRPINGEDKHPDAIGNLAKNTYYEVWSDLAPIYEEVWNGKSVARSNFMIELVRSGFREECFFDVSYSPLRDLAGNIEGILVICVETTEKVMNLRSMEQANEDVALANEELQVTNEEMAEVQSKLEETVSELADRESELRAEKDKLIQFFLQSPEGICILDGPKHVFELVNPMYQQLFPGRQLLGMSVTEALPELKTTNIQQILDEVYISGHSFEGKELMVPLARTPKSEVENRYFNFTYQARKDRQGKTDGILVFVVEVTDMVLVRRKIEAHADRLRVQLNAIPNIAWTCDSNGYIQFYNQQFYDYTGHDEAYFAANGWVDIIHPDDIADNNDSFINTISGTTGGEWEVREKRHDGQYRWHLVRLMPIKDDTGSADHWIGTATDIHDLKTLQQQKDDFISIASHELKTPITSLKASLQLLERIKDNPTPMLPKLIMQATRSMTKISELIEDLLDAGKVNESQLQLKKTSFNVSALLTGCCDHIRAAGTHKLIFEGDETLKIYADEHRIDQVIVNFVNNAVKYAPGSNEIYLNVEKLPNATKIMVKDFGMGIPADKLPYVFDRYYQAVAEGNQYSGLGLGLYISSEIIKRHNGEIGVESELGKGSTFWFTIPDAN